MKLKTIIGLCILTTLLTGCTSIGGGSESTSRTSSTGTDGLSLTFLDGYPTNKYVVSDSEPFSVIFEVRNKGSWPEDQDRRQLDNAKVYLSGFDDDIIQVNSHYEDLDPAFLPGFSLLNPDGGFDNAEFKGFIHVNNLVTDTYTPTILGTLCFPYVTKAGPTVCIDPTPFDKSRDKVCTIGSQTFSGQGAPVAVTKIEQEASSTKTQFKITIKNVGGGEVINIHELDACDPHGDRKLTRNSFDEVDIVHVLAGATDITSDCGPFIGSRTVRLNNGEGFIICSLDNSYYQQALDAYSTTLTVELEYGYRKTASKRVTIQRVSSIR